MNENAKTITFAAVAAVLGLGAYLSTPQVGISEKDVVDSVVGKPLFEKFTDPAAASTLKIVKFDANQVRIVPFELARDKKSDAWVIPSHNSYPADAASQVSKVANAFVGLKILTVESTKADDQKLYGVVEPDAVKLEAGETNFGSLVRMQDDKGESLVDIVIGKTIRDDKAKRYVRKVGSDAIYTAEFDPTPLTTDFSAWIEGDLLKLSSNDVETLTIRDYNILPTQRGGGQLDRNFDAVVSYSTNDNKWNADSVKVYGDDSATDRVLADDEQLNTSKLNEIKNALDNLKIVDVVRKPQGLAADLKADKNLLDDNEKILSLYKKGFIPVQTESGGLDLLSSSGELAVTLKDGVEYLLRFGKSEENTDMVGDDKKLDASAALNRALFVTVRLNESRYPAPDLKPLPEKIEDLASPETAAAPKTDDATMKDVQFAPASPDATSPAKQPETPVDPPSGKLPTTPDQSRSIFDSSVRLVAAQSEAAVEPSAVAAPGEPAAAESSPATPPTDDASKAVTSAESPEEAKERLEAAREKVTKENQRLIDERNDKLAVARKKAGELNARFAEWYYEISDADYKRMRIKLEELIQKKGASSSKANDGDPPPDFGGGLPFNLQGN